MKNQALFSSKDKSKKLKCCLLQFLFGTLRVEGSYSKPQSLRARNCEATTLQPFLFANDW